MENYKNKFKVVIWGHKIHSNTFSYINRAYYDAFERLGFEVYWFDNNDDVSNFNFENSIFFTEHQVDGDIPLRKDCKYILHHCSKEKYDGLDVINLCNYVNDCTLGKSQNYPGSSVERINYFTYYDKSNKALYQPWATTTFKEDFEEFVPIDKTLDKILYVGSVWADNIEEMKSFHKGCVNRGKELQIVKTDTEEDSKKAIMSSYVAPDARLRHHVNVGYIPCRIFKNISYGKMPATNSPFVRDFFGINSLPFTNSCEDLVRCNEDFYNSPSCREEFKFVSEEVKQNHTYITRVENLLRLL